MKAHALITFVALYWGYLRLMVGGALMVAVCYQVSIRMPNLPRASLGPSLRWRLQASPFLPRWASFPRGLTFGEKYRIAHTAGVDLRALQYPESFPAIHFYGQVEPRLTTSAEAQRVMAHARKRFRCVGDIADPNGLVNGVPR
jgi:hypothetical protein